MKTVRAQTLLLWLFAVVLTLAFAALGRWQYGRGAAKESFLADWQTAMQAAPVELATIDWSAPVSVPQRVVGEVAVAQPFRWLLLDNQREGSAVGVRAYAVVSVSDAAVLADFGWLPLGEARQLPELPALLPHRLSGLRLPWPGQGIQLAANPWDQATTPLLLTTLQRDEIAAALGQPLAPGVIKVAPHSRFGFQRQLQALPNTLPPEKHYGYALQWFGLAATTVVVALVLTFRSHRR